MSTYPQGYLDTAVGQQERLADARTFAGVRQAHYARQTGTLVIVVDAASQGLDPGDDGETKWYSICEDHSRLVGHSTLALAKAHAADPRGWCGVCNGTEEADDVDS